MLGGPRPPYTTLKGHEMINFEFADNAQIRLDQTDQLPIFPDNHCLYFMVVDQESMNVHSYGCDVRGLNNLHKMLSGVEDHEEILILCNWKGMYQAHTFKCDRVTLMDMVKNSLGTQYTSELPCGSAF